MPLDSTKKTFTFFKMYGCGACTHFDELIFQKLIVDAQVLNAVNLDYVTFGRDEQGVVHLLSEHYPDFKINYAPYLWLNDAYDESTGYHLSPSTMNDPSLNKRRVGLELKFGQDSTFANVKRWILERAVEADVSSVVIKRSTFKRLNVRRK